VKISSETSVIICGEPVTIRGEDLSGVSAVTIGERRLGVVSRRHDALICEAFNIFQSPFAFGETVPLTVTGSAGTHTVHVTLEPPEGVQYVVVDGVQPYLSQGLAVVDGDQMATETDRGSVALLLSPNTDVKYTPAAPDGTIHMRYWYNPRTLAWGEGTVTVDGGLASGPVEWTGTPTPPPAAVGASYTYTIGTLVAGDRPITLTDAGTALPPGLSYDDAAYPETISGVPTTPGVYTGIITRADNGTSADSEPYTITVWQKIPTISMFTVLTNTIGEATLMGKTDTPSGTVYAIVDTSPNRPTNEQIKNGLNAAGQPALGAGSATVSPGGLDNE
jgi:hypothetical protein